MKIAIAQINPTVGDLDRNAEKIANIYEDNQNKSDLVIFPEMCITGYPPQDLLLESEFVIQAENILKQLAAKTGSTSLIAGTVRNENGLLKNCAAILQNGEITGYRDKSLLPTYDVFDEARYFNAASENYPLELNHKQSVVKIGLHICEDLWNTTPEDDIVCNLAGGGAELLINLSASPYSVNRIEDRIKLVRQKVEMTGRPFIYCNLVGAQDELVFDGHSFVVNEDGDLIHLSPGFIENVSIIEMENSRRIDYTTIEESEQIHQALVLGVKDYFRKTNHNAAVIGLSGGIDSAVTAAITAKALGAKNVYGFALPSCYSSEHSINDAEELADNLGINFDIIPINDVHNSVLETLKEIIDVKSESLALENLQARLRGNLLMAIANYKGALVLNTGNKTETALGYATLYGDMCGALGVISDLNKHEVYALAKWMNRENEEIIPDNSISKPPSAELKPDQVDPFDYTRISPMVEKVITENKHLHQLGEEGYVETEVREILRKIRYAEFKRRQSAPGLKVSRKAFGIGRRYPIVNQFKG